MSCYVCFTSGDMCLCIILLPLQFPALRDFVKIGKPVWGTCAGLIFLADKATGRYLFYHYVTG